MRKQTLFQCNEQEECLLCGVSMMWLLGRIRLVGVRVPSPKPTHYVWCRKHNYIQYVLLENKYRM
jgi:hypothetical protein